MEKFVQNLEKKDSSDITSPVLEILQIDKDSLNKRLETEPSLRGRIEKAKEIAKELEDKNLDHVKADANFAMILKTILNRKDRREVLQSSLQNQIIVDLGCGSNNWGIETIEEFKPSIYIGVDKYAENSFLKKNNSPEENSTKTDFIEEDMLVFVSMLPDNSVNFMLNGIDETIIPHTEQKYWEKLAEEIKRATKNGGIIFGCGSSFYKFIKKEDEYNNLESSYDPEKFFILKK